MAQKQKVVHVDRYVVPARVVPAHDRGLPGHPMKKKDR
jgi:hypothetical protein